MSDSVKVPVELLVDLDLSKVDSKDISKTLESKLSGVRNSMSQIFAQIDTSKATKPLLDGIKSVESSFTKLNNANKSFNAELAKAGKSTSSYKQVAADLDAAKAKLSELGQIRSNWEDAQGNFSGTESMWQYYLEACEKYEMQLGKVFELQKQVDNPGQFAKDADPTAQANVESSYRKLVSAVASYNQEAQKFNNNLGTNNKTQEYQDELKNFKKIEQAIDKLNAKYKEMQALGKLTPDGLAKMKYEAEQLQGKLETSKGKLTDMVNSGKAFSISNGNAEAELNGINTRLNDSKTKLNEISGASANMGTNLRGVNTVIQSLTKTVNKLASGFLRCITGSILLGKQGKSTGNSLTKVFKKLQRSVLMYGFGFRTAYYAIKRLRTLFMKEIKLMAQQSSEMNSQITSLTMSFNRLKGSLGTAFQPLASVVIPILQTAMNYLTAFLESLGRFFATLTGQSYIYKAVAKNINSVAGAAKNANKQLGSYDKLDVISKDSGSGSGENDLGFDYEKVGIGAGSNFAKLIKEAWEKQDFTEVGLVIGNKLTSALDNIEWSSIREKAKGIANSIATLINGFFSAPDLGQSLGNSIANALGTAIDFAFQLMTTLDFEQAGQVVGNIINSFLTKMAEVDETGLNGWAKLGQSYQRLVRGIIELIITAMSTTNWFEVDQAIGTYISNIEWGKVIWDFTRLVGEIMKAIGEALMGWAKEDPLSAILVTVIVALAGALTAAAKVFSLLKTFVEMKKVLGAVGMLKGGGGSAGAAGGATDIAQGLDQGASSAEAVSSGTSKLTSSLTGLIKNLALGLVVLLEVVAAAVIFVGAIWAIGKLLDEVRIAWEPVMEHGDKVAIAMGLGAAILLAIGVVTALLGAAGAYLIPLLALGLVVLLEMGVAAALFLTEVIVIGVLLEQLGKAWEPVLANSEPVEYGIKTGTTLLIAIGAAAALLGAAAVASAGALPIAIALGTAMLVKLAENFIEFCDSLEDVAVRLQELAPTLQKLTEILPGLKTDMHNFTSFMKEFAGEVVKFTAANAIASIGATINKVIGFFTADPIKTLYNEVTKQTEEFNQLVPALEKINPLIDKAIKLVGEYKSKMGSFENATGSGGGLFGTIVSGAKGVINGLIGMFEGMANGVIKCVNALIKGLNKLSFDVPSWVPGIGGKKFGFNIKQISEIKIPRLATGAVIPPNKEFLAMLGDQKHGTNIEAPLDTIKQALAEVMAEFGGGSNKPIILQLDGKTVAKVVWDEEAKYYKQTGKYSPAY